MRAEYLNFTADQTGAVYATVKCYNDADELVITEQEIISQEQITQFSTPEELKTHLEETRWPHWQDRIVLAERAKAFAASVTNPLVLERL